jgi:hypothetical protein
VTYIDKALAAQSAKLKPFRYDGPVGTKGKWTIREFTIPKESLGVLRLVRDGGRGCAPGKYHQLLRTEPNGSKTIVMSDTDAEMIDFLSVIRPGWDGQILIGGLGMGLAIKTLLMMPEVGFITVVELDPELIELTKSMYAKEQRVEIIQGDIFKWKVPKGAKYDWAWFDIWDTISDDNIPDFQRLKRKYRKYLPSTDRLTFWAERECVLMKRDVDPRHWY